MKTLFYIFLILNLFACNTNSQTNISNTNTKHMEPKVDKTEDDWKKLLSPEQYHVLREKGTELPYSGKYYLHKEKGTYVCAACDSELFTSEQKFDSGCGWPSFSDVLDSTKVNYIRDTSHGMIRTEITCANCGGHLGHVFEDGPDPTGLRYCINSISIEFKKE